MSNLNEKRFCYFSFFCLILLTAKVNGQIAITTNQNLDVYANELAGAGVTPFNVTFSGDQNQIGLFNAEIFNFGLADGLILATGDVLNAEGPNDSGSNGLGGGNFGATDPDIDSLDGLSHNDAAILEFDFIASGQNLNIEFIFASEEYPEYSGSDLDGDGLSDCGNVGDVFGVFLSGVESMAPL